MSDPCWTCDCTDSGCRVDDLAERRRDARLGQRASEQQYLDQADKEARAC